MTSPEGWKRQRIGDFAEKVQDGTHFSPSSTDGPYRYLTSKNIRMGRLDLRTSGWISEAEHRGIYRRCDPRKGDVLLTKDGANTGNVVVNPLDEEFSLLSSVAMIRCDESRSSGRYLYHLLASSSGRQQMEAAMAGNAISRLTLKKIVRLVVDVPTLEEQRRIAEILDTIDEFIQATERVIAKLMVTATGLATAAVAAALAGGEIRSIGQIADEAVGSLVQTGPFGSQLHASDYVGEGVPTFMPTDIAGGRLDVAGAAKITESKANELGRHRLRVGDVLFGRRGDLSRCAVVPAEAAGGLCGTGCLLVRIAEDVIAADWLALVYRHDHVQRQVLARAVGSTMLNLSGGLIRALLVPLPTEESEHLLTAFRSNEQRLELEGENLTKLRDARAGLAADLLSGRVRTVAA